MKILVATNHLERLAGSEIVALEICEYFRWAGHEVTVFTNWLARPMAEILKDRDYAVLTEAEHLHPFHFNIIYCQHHTLPLLNFEVTDKDMMESVFIFGRLSPRSFMEMGGWVHDNIFGDCTIANSGETRDCLEKNGVLAPVMAFHNAAPDKFFVESKDVPVSPRRILAISNHLPDEVRDALAILRGSAEVKYIGRNGGEVVLVTPQHIAECDLVISIGKSIQYGLVGRTPVYVYDHFGGPGYLEEANFETATYRNFSGRCTPVRRDAEWLASDILERYGAGRAFALNVTPQALERFRLSRYLEALLAIPATDNQVRRTQMTEQAAAVERERSMAAFVRAQYVEAKRRAQELKGARKRLEKWGRERRS